MASEVSAVVTGVDKVIAALQAKSLKGRKQLTVAVEYTAPYAIYVHEDLAANHPNGGQAKYLEAPARRLRNQMAKIVRKTLKNKHGLENGLREAGQLLLDESRKLVPVDTGFLRDSGQVVIREAGAAEVVAPAFAGGAKP